MRYAAVLALAVLLSACTGALGTNVAGMSADQLKEWVKHKDATCSTITGVYMGATFTAKSVSVDKGIPPGAGSVKITPDCGVEITAEPRVAPTPR